MGDKDAEGVRTLVWAFRASVIAAAAYEERVLTFGVNTGDEDRLRRLWRETDTLAREILALASTAESDGRVKREARAWLSGETKQRRRSANPRVVAAPDLETPLSEVSSTAGREALAAVGAVLAKAAHSAKRRAREDSAATEALRALQRLGRRLQEVANAPALSRTGVVSANEAGTKPSATRTPPHCYE